MRQKHCKYRGFWLPNRKNHRSLHRCLLQGFQKDAKTPPMLYGDFYGSTKMRRYAVLPPATTTTTTTTILLHRSLPLFRHGSADPTTTSPATMPAAQPPCHSQPRAEGIAGVRSPTIWPFQIRRCSPRKVVADLALATRGRACRRPSSKILHSAVWGRDRRGQNYKMLLEIDFGPFWNDFLTIFGCTQEAKTS